MACQNCSLVVSCKYSGSQNFLLYNVRRLTKVWGKFSSVAQSCSTLCDPMDCSTPGLPVHHQLPEPTHTHVHRVGDVISSSVIPLSFCLQSFPASGSFLMSWFFTSGGQSIGVSASVSVLPAHSPLLAIQLFSFFMGFFYSSRSCWYIIFGGLGRILCSDIHSLAG